MEERIVIKYTGEKDAYFELGYYFSLTLRREWFYSKHKNCYGIPIYLKYLDGTGDAVASISLNNSYNDLSVDICENQPRYNGVIWLEQNAKDSNVTLYSQVNISSKNCEIVIDFSRANLSESIDFNCNSAHAQDCYNNLELRELWKLWRECICLDGICIDTTLKNKLRADDFIDSETEYTDTAAIYYVWPGTKSGNKQIQNGLEISAEFKHEHAYKDMTGNDHFYDSLTIYATDNAHIYEDYNDTTALMYEYLMDDVDWNENLTNLCIGFYSDNIKDIWKEKYLDIPVSYRGSNIVLRIILTPYVFDYQKQPDNSLWIINCTTRCFTGVLVPAFVGGQRVTRIGKKAFQWCKEMTSIEIPDGIESIGSFGFRSCINLESVDIPASVKDIGRHAFRNCIKLSSVSFSGNLKEIRSYTFSECASLEEFIVPEGCEKIGYCAFYGSGLKRVIISKTVKELGQESFRCDNLKVALPISLEYLLKEKAKWRVWPAPRGSVDGFVEMNFSKACDIFMSESSGYKGTVLAFYDDQYNVVKKVKVIR